MAWYNVRFFPALWNGGTPKNVSTTDPLPTKEEVSEFWRIKSKRLALGEEIRYDIPENRANASGYTAVGPDNGDTASAVWSVIKTEFNAGGKPSRERIRLNVAWDDRATGW